MTCGATLRYIPGPPPFTCVRPAGHKGPHWDDRCSRVTPVAWTAFIPKRQETP